jgi:hypothetical protein
VATESDTGKRVIAVAVEAGQLATLEAARGVKHRHLAGIVEVVREPDPTSLPEGVALPTAGGIAVAEYVPGRTLRAQLEGAAMNPAKAVAWTLRLAEAVQAVHQAGAVHGAISPRSVIAEPEGRKIVPVLAQLLAPPLGALCTPERLRGSVETSADDVWALHALLFVMLTRQAPFRGASREALQKAMLTSKPRALSSFGVDEPVLDEILSRGLTGEKRLRVVDLPELIQTLDGWERDRTVMPPRRSAPARPASRGLAEIVGGTALGPPRDDGVVLDDDSLPDDEGTELRAIAPPLGALPDAGPATLARPAGTEPAAQAPGPAPAMPVHKRVSVNPFEKKPMVWPLVALAAVAGGGGVYLAVGPAAPAESVPTVQTSSAPAPVAAKAVQQKPRRSAAQERDACVASYFPEGAFSGAPSFEFVCSSRDFREIATSLHAQVTLAPPVSSANAVGGGSNDASANAVVATASSAQPVGESLGWYELPAAAIIRQHCCPAAAPLTLPESTGWCEQLQSAVRRVAEDSGKAGDLAPAARAFDKAVNCLFANKLARPYAYPKPPSDDNRRAFQQFLGRAAVSEARR